MLTTYANGLYTDTTRACTHTHTRTRKAHKSLEPTFERCRVLVDAVFFVRRRAPISRCV